MRFQRLLTVVTLGCAAFVVGCASGPKAVSPASADTSAQFDRLKALQGEWMMADEGGQQVVGSVFAVTSNGSAVREVMFPGQPHEMTNMYHLDGDSIIATHYCAQGNQPRMRCTDPANGVFVFEGFDCTNLASTDTEYMASMTLTVVDPTHVRQDWSSMKGGAKSNHASFELTKK